MKIMWQQQHRQTVNPRLMCSTCLYDGTDECQLQCASLIDYFSLELKTKRLFLNECTVHYSVRRLISHVYEHVGMYAFLCISESSRELKLSLAALFCAVNFMSEF